MDLTAIVSQRIKNRREQLHLSQDALSDLMGYTGKSTICRIENGDNDARLSKVEEFAKVLQTSPAYLMGWVDDPELTHEQTLDMYQQSDLKSTNNNSDTSDTIDLPILGDVAAGVGVYADNNILGYEKVPLQWIRGGGDYVLLHVRGDSMYPKFEEDDLLIVRCQTSVDSGDYAVAVIDGDNGVVKKIVYGDNWIELRSVNPKYPPRRFEDSEVERVRIFGIVKKSIRSY